eukprot:COSAG02_NODE_394_length_23152_cov_13.232204_7_plen_102_part_00
MLLSLRSHAHANRSPPHVPGDAIRDGQFRPVAGESAERPPAGQEKTFAFHQDSGRVNKELETSDGIVPRLSVKAIACEWARLSSFLTPPETVAFAAAILTR